MPNPNGQQNLFLVLPISAAAPVNAWSSFLQVVTLRRDASNVCRFLPKHPFVIAAAKERSLDGKIKHEPLNVSAASAHVTS